MSKYNCYINLDITFIVKLIKLEIGAPALNAKLIFNRRPINLRRNNLLLIASHRTNYGQSEIITRLSGLFNMHSSVINLDLLLNTIKNNLLLRFTCQPICLELS